MALIGSAYNPCTDPDSQCFNPAATVNSDECAFCSFSFWDATTVKWRQKPTSEITIKLIALLIVSLIGLMGNLSIIIIILKNRLLRLQPTNLFLLNMAVADFLMLLFIPTLYFFKQNVIFRFYYLGKVPCYMTPYLIIAFFVAGTSSLSLITLNRLFGIRSDVIRLGNIKNRTAIIILAMIWVFALLSAIPTIHYRRYWVRYWSDQVEINCDDDAKTADKENKDFMEYNTYWLILLSITIYIPSLIMVVSFGFLYCRLKQSVRSFPYLSEQSRVVRIRSRVIRMLLVLVLVTDVCWAPWQFYTILYNITWKNLQPEVQKELKEWQYPLHDVKFFLIFFHCAVNPLIYGYWSTNMRKAFRLTFPWLFGNNPKYILQKSCSPQLKYTFQKIVAGTLQRQAGHVITPIKNNNNNSKCDNNNDNNNDPKREDLQIHSAKSALNQHHFQKLAPSPIDQICENGIQLHDRGQSTIEREEKRQEEKADFENKEPNIWLVSDGIAMTVVQVPEKVTTTKHSEGLEPLRVNLKSSRSAPTLQG